MTKKNIVCYSGGHSSALVAVEAVRKYGKDNVVLLNHDISSKVEHADIKRFKQEVADYLGLPVTQANMEGFEELPPLKIARKLECFTNMQTQQALCTHRLKTEPFMNWLKDNYQPGDKILYGFDVNEEYRIQRRIGVMGINGYLTDYPLARWDRTIVNIEDAGIARPITYKIFKHANCIGCLKAGRQHWYIVYCLYPEIYEEAIEAENEIGYSIIKDIYLEELVPKYKAMQAAGICPSEKGNSAAFWAKVEKALGGQKSFLPCECAI